MIRLSKDHFQKNIIHIFLLKLFALKSLNVFMNLALISYTDKSFEDNYFF